MSSAATPSSAASPIRCRCSGLARRLQRRPSNDAQAARAAGCPVILVSYGYNHGLPVAGIDADAVVDRLDAIRL